MVRARARLSSFSAIRIWPVETLLADDREVAGAGREPLPLTPEDVAAIDGLDRASASGPDAAGRAAGDPAALTLLVGRLGLRLGRRARLGRRRRQGRADRLGRQQLGLVVDRGGEED